MYEHCCRVGVAKFISMLAQHVGVEMRPHSTTLLKVLFPAVQTEHSAAARRAFAAACGTVAKYSGTESFMRHISLEFRVVTLYAFLLTKRSSLSDANSGLICTPCW
jgi:hypothetical protein